MRKNMHLVWTGIVPSKPTSGYYWWDAWVLLYFWFKSLFIVKDHRYSCLWLDGFRAGPNQRCFSSYRKLLLLWGNKLCSKSSCPIKTNNGKGFVVQILHWWFRLPVSKLCVQWLIISLCWETGVFSTDTRQQAVTSASPEQPAGRNGCRH